MEHISVIASRKSATEAALFGLGVEYQTLAHRVESSNQGLARLASPEETLISMVIYVKSEMCWSKQMFPS